MASEVIVLFNPDYPSLLPPPGLIVQVAENIEPFA